MNFINLLRLSTVVIAIIVIIAAVGVGSYFLLKGIGDGGVLGTLPVYPGAQETNDATTQEAITGLMTGMGSPSGWAEKAYITAADPQTVIDWYKTQMSGWTKVIDNTISGAGTTLYWLAYTKGNDAAAIATVAYGNSNYLILAAGPRPVLVYSGSQSWEIPSDIQEYIPAGVEATGYTVSGASTQDILNWYKDQMTGWTLENEVPVTSTSGRGVLIYRSGDDGTAIAAIAATSETGLPGTCYILLTGPWSAFSTFTCPPAGPTATLVSIAVTPVNPSITVGNTEQFAASGTYSGWTTQDITTTQVTWSSSNTSAATVNSSGLATTVSAGTTTITATSGSISGSTTLTVTPGCGDSCGLPTSPGL